MSYDNGHIYAPVSVNDVKSVLGIASDDVYTLCDSNDAINPNSLIRPLHCVIPEFSPDDFETANNTGPVPTAGSGWYYNEAKWGYFVPYVSNPANIKLIYEKEWIRDIPSGTSYRCLTHFDGYLHNVVPTLPVSAQMVAGEKIRVFLWPGNVQKNIISSTGKGNKGGVVAIYEVLGSVKIGCTVFKGNTLVGHYISPSKIGTTQFQDVVQIDTNITATSLATYTIIPWATDGDILNGAVVYGSKFFSLKFSSDFNGYIQDTIPSTTVAITNVDVSTSTYRIDFNTTVLNQYGTQQSVSNFRLRISYIGDNGVVKKDISLTGNTALAVPANSSKSLSLYTTNSEVLNNYNRLTSMTVVAQWASPTGSKEISSIELMGLQQFG